MATIKGLRRIAKGAERGLGKVALVCHRRPLAALLTILLVTAGAFFFARTLRLDSDLAELLPQSFPSIRALHKLTKRFGGVGWLVVVGRDAPPDQLRRFADDLAPKLAALEHVRYVDYKRPTQFFEDRALYFLSPADLEQVNDQIAARVAWERRHHNPLYLDLENSKPPPLHFDNIIKKLGKDGQGSDNAWLAKQVGEPYYIDTQKRMIALLAKPASQAIDLSFAKQMVAEVQGLINHIDLKKYGPHMRVQLTGRYKKRVDLQAMLIHDLQLTSLLAALLVLLYLVVHFRRLLAVALILVPLLVGLVWTFGFTAVVFGRLNILTGFVGAIMLGLGIDHGIHLLGRYEHERNAGHDEDAAIQNTFGETGRAVMVAAVTTMVAFACLGLSEFRAFREFGVVAAAGMVLTVAAYSVTLPALIGVAVRFGWKPRRHALTQRRSGLPRLVQARAGYLVAASVAVLIIAALALPKARFDYNFNSLESNDLPSFVVDKEVNKILGFTYIPVAILTDNLKQERYLSRELRARKKAKGSASTIDMVASSADMVPLHQQEKAPLIAAIGKTISGIEARWINDRTARKEFVALQRMVKAKPFTRDDLPKQLQLLFKGVGGKGEQGFVLVFPSFSLSDGRKMVKYAQEVRDVPLPDGRMVSAAGEDLILADILTMVVHEAPEVLSLTLVAIILTLILLLGSVREGLLCLVPAAFSLVVTLGLLPLVHLEINYLNMVMIPVLFGIGVDGGAHIVTRLGAGDSMDDVLQETGRNIAGAILTTMLGFGALMLAHHHGLNSLGELAVLGLCVNLVASLVVLPGLLTWWHAHGDRHPAPLTEEDSIAPSR